MHSYRPKMRPFSALILLLFILLASVSGFCQISARTVPMNLDQLVQRSATIVHGQIISARVERHPQLTNLDTVVVTVRVTETLKGSASQTFTFRQFVWDVRNKKNAWGYGKGQEVLLMMNAPSEYGLSSPVGAEQGRFKVSRDASGKAEVANGTGNISLFRGLDTAAAKTGAKLPAALTQRTVSDKGGAVSLDDLKQAIRSLVGVSK